MTMLNSGERGVLLKPLRLENRVGRIHPGGTASVTTTPGATVPAGTPFTVIDNTVPHLDWFEAIVNIDGWGTQRVGWGIVSLDTGFCAREGDL